MKKTSFPILKIDVEYLFFVISYCFYHIICKFVAIFVAPCVLFSKDYLVIKQDFNIKMKFKFTNDLKSKDALKSTILIKTQIFKNFVLKKIIIDQRTATIQMTNPSI